MFELIPAIDLRGGRCVRLFQGDYARETVFGDDPVAMAHHWERQGAGRLHVVDLDGARASRPVQLDLVGGIARAVRIPIQLGGGLRRLADVEAAFSRGVNRVVLGTAAIRADAAGQAEAFRLACGSAYGDQVVIGLDARDGKLAVQGWTETTEQDAFAFAERLRDEGFSRIVYTDISRDGALTGPNLAHVERLARIPGLAVLASGGISRFEDLTALKAAGAEAVIVGQALYSGAISLPQAFEHLKAESVGA
jgi:phosphoribosylformimino-5-aminoimidazole carboxamide ribotide isomerase